jgi:hypothetical protein
VETALAATVGPSLPCQPPTARVVALVPLRLTTLAPRVVTASAGGFRLAGGEMSQDRKKHHRPIERSDLGKWPHDKLWPPFLYSKADTPQARIIDNNKLTRVQAHIRRVQ